MGSSHISVTCPNHMTQDSSHRQFVHLISMCHVVPHFHFNHKSQAEQRTRSAKLPKSFHFKTSVIDVSNLLSSSLIDALLVRTQRKKRTTSLFLFLLLWLLGTLGILNCVYTYPVISLSMTIFCRPVDRLLLGRPGEPTRSVGDATGAPVGFVRAAFTSRRIRAKGPSLVTVL